MKKINKGAGAYVGGARILKAALAAAFALCLFSLVSCEKKPAAVPAELPVYDIAYSGMTCGSPIAVAELLGFYEEEGVKINLVSGTKFAEQLAAMGSGKMPILNGDFQLFVPVQNGHNVKLISGLHEGCIKVLVPKDSPIKSVADLKGKSVIVEAIGGTPMMVASVAAKHAGLDPRQDGTGDITWKLFEWDQLIQAMEKGEGDAVAVWDPFATQAELSGNYRVLVDITKDPVFAGRNCCFIFASGVLLEEKSEDIAKILRAVQRAIKWTGENPRKAAELLIESKKIASTDVDFITTLIESYNYKNYYGKEAIAKAREDAEYFTREMVNVGYLKADTDIKSFIDGLFVDVFSE